MARKLDPMQPRARDAALRHTVRILPPIPYDDQMRAWLMANTTEWRGVISLSRQLQEIAFELDTDAARFRQRWAP